MLQDAAEGADLIDGDRPAGHGACVFVEPGKIPAMTAKQVSATDAELAPRGARRVSDDGMRTGVTASVAFQIPKVDAW